MGSGGGTAPRGLRAGGRQAASVRGLLHLVASTAPPSSPDVSSYLGSGTGGAPGGDWARGGGGGSGGGGRPSLAEDGRAGALLAEPEVAVTLLGSAGWAAEEAARCLWWRFPDWRRGRGKQGEGGRAGGGVRVVVGNTNRRCNFTCPGGSPADFLPAAAGALPLSFTAETSVAEGRWGCKRPPHTPRAAPSPPLGLSRLRINPASAGRTPRPQSASPVGCCWTPVREWALWWWWWWWGAR